LSGVIYPLILEVSSEPTAWARTACSVCCNDWLQAGFLLLSSCGGWNFVFSFTSVLCQSWHIYSDWVMLKFLVLDRLEGFDVFLVGPHIGSLSLTRWQFWRTLLSLPLCLWNNHHYNLTTLRSFILKMLSPHFWSLLYRYWLNAFHR
jgi:hypothetical protein